jgi:hypothetical protein
MDEVKNYPTMIIPNGTEITVNERGQLSIRTPGNLVIQNSGVYSMIECRFARPATSSSRTRASTR